MTDITPNLCPPPLPSVLCAYSDYTQSWPQDFTGAAKISIKYLFFKIQTELPTVYNGNSGYGYSMITATTNPSRLKAAAAIGLLFYQFRQFTFTQETSHR